MRHEDPHRRRSDPPDRLRQDPRDRHRRHPLLDDPSGINVDGYHAWLFEMQADPAPLMDVGGYYQFLDENWEKTQRHIKGKINTEED